jgi:quercetin dioxygenase-like cupin family protein
LQRPNEGFSLQRHITHKTEVFHILEVQPGAQVFLCDYEDWQKIYNKDTFMDWLSDHSNEQYDQYKFDPMPGDIFVIDKLNVVHTVIGCVLEEFATISTDMVDRLYDQNADKPIPSNFNRSYAQDRLKSISNPKQSRLVDTRLPKRATKDIVPVQIPGGYMLPLARTNISASRYIIEPFKASEPEKDDYRAATIYITEGNGSIILGDEQEAQMSSPPTIPVSKGDVLMIPVGIYRAFVNEGNQALELAEHKIAVDVAFL